MKNILLSLLNQFSGRLENSIENLTEFEKVINYHFKNTDLVKAALSHTSLMKTNDIFWPFERMEFLGDSVLGVVVADHLFNKYPEYTEGDLSKLKSKLVSKKYLSYKARKVNLGKFIMMSGEAEQNKGRDSSTILCDTIEALICAVYLDSNLDKASDFIKRVILNDFAIEITRSKVTNYKSILQEFTQSNFKSIPTYRIFDETGPDHNKIFSIRVIINQEIIGEGQGPNKKSAEQHAAKAACQRFELIQS